MPERVRGDGSRLEHFVIANTAPATARLSPHISLHLATELTPLWQASEVFLQQNQMPPPYWAFAWPGAEALARYVLDHTDIVRGLRVLDFAAGCGLAGIAAAQAGAACVTAAEIDHLAGAAIRLNAASNNVDITIRIEDITGQPSAWDVILCGDIFYEAPMTNRVLPWLRTCAASATVLAADPGRAYVPRDGISEIARITVPTLRELEDRDSRAVVLFRIHPLVEV